MVGMDKFIYILVFLFMINLSCINFDNIWVYWYFNQFKNNRNMKYINRIQYVWENKYYELII